MQTEVRVNYLNCHIHVPSKHVEANNRHTNDVTIWLSRTTDNSNIFIRSREVRDNESRLYIGKKPGGELKWPLMGGDRSSEVTVSGGSTVCGIGDIVFLMMTLG